MRTSPFNAKEKIMQILKEEPETRNSDALLTIRYFERQTGHTLPEMRSVLLGNGPTQETIRRCRQKAQAENLGLHSDNLTAIRRGQLRKEYEEFAKEKK